MLPGQWIDRTPSLPLTYNLFQSKSKTSFMSSRCKDWHGEQFLNCIAGLTGLALAIGVKQLTTATVPELDGIDSV
jgi:hypothetical protein